ncbi:MAG: hypothetical protein DRP06_03205 [Candidatus Aenigmatarchaeota archaeon]|nr:MAG: hypothetical protein DRP06_03205 [Candidatus Aenigmarchaeota archaeon]
MAQFNEESGTACCPRFDPRPWMDQRIIWMNKLFVKYKVRSLFHVPWNLKNVLHEKDEIIQFVGAFAPQPLTLSYEKAFLTSEIYVAVSRDVPGEEMVKLSGTFLTKVYEGSSKNMSKWIKEMKEYVKSKNEEIERLYFYFTTCPDCAKVYGKNYVVFLAKIKEDPNKRN